MACKACGLAHFLKNGRAREVRRYRCKSCGLNYVLGDRRTAPSRAAQRALAVILYALGKASFGFLGKLFGASRTTAYHWIRAEAERLGEPEVPGDIREMEFDQMWHFVKSKKTSDGSSRRWIVARGSWRSVARVAGGRDAGTFRRLYAKVRHLTGCRFFTDDRDAFAKVLPAERHRIGKTHTVTTEQDNPNTRHRLGRFTRRTKVASKQDQMVDLSLRLWHALSQPEIFAQYQKIAIPIYR